MGRGGCREGSGRKSGWKHSETQTIRVPKVFAAQLLELARKMDGESGIPDLQTGIPLMEPENLPQIDSETVSEGPNSLDVAPGQISLFDINDSVSESKDDSMTGMDLNKYLKFNAGQVSRMKGRFRNAPEKFIEWSRKREKKLGLPVVGWRYNEITKLYDSVGDSCDDF